VITQTGIDRVRAARPANLPFSRAGGHSCPDAPDIKNQPAAQRDLPRGASPSARQITANYLTAIRFGCALACLRIETPRTPLRPVALTFSASAVSGRMKRR
jgi:hypothetical protein